jgi:hypothetical protein
MSVGVVTKVQIGFSLGAVSVMTIATAELLMHWGPLRSRAGIVCGVLGGAGFLLWLAGRARSQSNDSAEHSLAWFTKPRYWGLLLALTALLAYSHSAYRRFQAKAPVVVAPAALPQAAPAAPKVVFPALRLQGIVFQGAQSSALINGRVLYVGDEISLVQVVAIGPDHVVVTLQGQTNLLQLGKSSGE